MTIDSSATDLLEGGGTSFKFQTVGDIAKGAVVSATAVQQKDFTTGKPKFWDDGNPMMQLVITLQTDERDADDATDDGTRRIFAKGEMLSAIRVALAGRKLEEGGVLAVQYTGDGEPKQRGFNPPKLYRAQYEAPSGVSADVDSLI